MLRRSRGAGVAVHSRSDSIAARLLNVGQLGGGRRPPEKKAVQSGGGTVADRVCGCGHDVAAQPFAGGRVELLGRASRGRHAEDVGSTPSGFLDKRRPRDKDPKRRRLRVGQLRSSARIGVVPTKPQPQPHRISGRRGGRRKALAWIHSDTSGGKFAAVTAPAELVRDGSVLGGCGDLRRAPFAVVDALEARARRATRRDVCTVRLRSPRDARALPGVRGAPCEARSRRPITRHYDGIGDIPIPFGTSWA